MFQRRRKPDDFSAEVHAHIELEAASLRARGLSEEDAFSQARRNFGSVLAAEERFYESRRWLWWAEFRQDLAYALRTLRKNPLLTGAAILTLALGIGANTAIFSVIDATLLRPLPYPQPERIIKLYARDADGDNGALSPATYLDFRRVASTFETLSAYREIAFNLTGQDRPERIAGVVVTPEFFSVLGVQSLVGRTLTPAQDSPGHARSVVLSHSLWQRRFGGDRQILGQTIQLDAEPLVVVGVMPPGFQYPPGSEAWRPARHAVPEHPLRPERDQSNDRGAHYLDMFGRLKSGLTMAQAQAQANTIAGQLKRQYGPDEEMTGASLVPLHEDLVGETRPALLVLLGAVALLLIIACANVANILLARAAARQKEVAIRGALGAGRARLFRQFLTESLTLGATGGALGIAIAYFGRAPLLHLVPFGSGIHLDARVLAFTAAISMLSALMFGVFPALQAAGIDLNSVLKEGARSTGSGRAGQARSILVVAEIAFAAVLLIGAGLLLRSFNRLLAIPEGFEADQVLSLQLSFSNARYPREESRARFMSQALERIGATPGVAASAVISRLPMNHGNSTRGLDVKGRVGRPGELAPDYLVVSPEYFRVMNIRMIAGRLFNDRDDKNAQPVVLVNQSLARLYFPNQDPIGQWVTVGACGQNNEWCQVVGVVEDVHQQGLDQPANPAVYVPYARDPWMFAVFVVRTRIEPRSAASAIEAAIHSIDKEQVLYNVRTMSEVVSQSLSPRRVRLLLIGSFAFLALGLACVGVYAVMAYSVAQRTQEIGVRMALGAGRADVLGEVVTHALKLSVAGVIAGAILSLAVTRFLATMLFGIRPTDPVTFLSVAGLLVLTGLLASTIPAWRATRVDPLTSLRVQ